ncbi:MAG TPA: hypothetical protein VN175_15325 [Rhizomicrobium sp.]|nr:hypothetical protein [Rhizomicrobium sp.]
MPKASLKALLHTYHEQALWLETQAEEFETGERKVTARMRGQDVDLSANLAVEYRHRAGNMRAIIQAYERLHPEEGS